jgi:serine/threonine-protein kinase
MPDGAQNNSGAALSRATSERDIDELRAAMRQAFHVGVPCWPSFFLLDLYVVYVLLPGTPLLPFFLARVVVTSIHLLAYRFLLPRLDSMARVYLLQFLFFGSGSAAIGFMALYCGGANSHYVHGVSIVLLVHAAMIPMPWRRAIGSLLFDAAPYPIVILIASFFDRSVHDSLHSREQLAYFGLDFTFVLATAIMGSLSSHFVWVARRQVYEARKLGRYRLKMRIGIGGMGEVWMAWDEKRGADVALKVLGVKAAQHSGAIARFEREARAAASLRSAHTVRVLDYGASDDGVRYLAMELLHGSTLADIVAERGPLHGARAAFLLRQACESLAEAHASGIVHRDIKPENLFVTKTEDGRELLKVLDFGIAKVSSTTDDATLTQAGWVGGTPAYMSPEVCAGKEADARTDVYSLGAVLYFLLTGAPPFEASNAAALMAAHLQQMPAPPSLLSSDVSPALDAITMRCLAKRATDRYADVRELDAALAASGAPQWTETQSKVVSGTTMQA